LLAFEEIFPPAEPASDPARDPARDPALELDLSPFQGLLYYLIF